jgi:hypothetical protein
MKTVPGDGRSAGGSDGKSIGVAPSLTFAATTNSTGAVRDKYIRSSADRFLQTPKLEITAW